MSVTSERLPLGPDLVPLTLWPGGLAQAPVLLVVPALGTPAGAYRRIAAALAPQVGAVAVLELRAVGESRIRPSRRVDFGYADLVDAELDAAIGALRLRFPGLPLVVLGHSLGGHLAVLHQARHPKQPIDGLLLVASGAPYWRAYGGQRWLVRTFGGVAGWSSRLLGFFPGHWLGFGGRQGRRLMVEWSQFVRNGQPEVSGWSDPQVWRLALKQVCLPTLALATSGDTYAPVAAVRHLLQLTAIPPQVEIIGAGPDGRDPGHFGWLKQPVAVVERIVTWLPAVRQAARAAA